MKSLFGTIRGRVRYGTLLLAALPLLIATAAMVAVSLRNARASLEARAQEQLVSLRAVKQAEIESYFEQLRTNVLVLSRTPGLAEDLRTLRASYRRPASAAAVSAARAALERYYTGDFLQEYQRRNPGDTVDMRPILRQLPDHTVLLQHRYIATNPSPLGKKHELVDTRDGTPYAAVHSRLQRYFGTAVEQYGFYDIFLADAGSGDLMYTYYKELDYGTSLLNGPYAKTLFAEAFRRALEAPAGTVVLTEFAPYLPSYEDAAAFMATPLQDGGAVTGVLLIQAPIDRINRIMTFGQRWAESGMGASGEAYLIGGDGTARSISRFLIEDRDDYFRAIAHAGVEDDVRKRIASRSSNVGLQRISTAGQRAAAAGQTGFDIYPDYRGVPVLGAYGPITVLGLNWALVAEIDEAEAFAPVAALLRQTALVGAALAGVVLLLAALVAARLAGSINRPIDALQGLVTRLNAGDWSARAKLAGQDELSQLGGALDRMLDERVAQLAAASRENEQLNSSVVEIMQAVSRLSQRDLTVRVPVTADVTGSISDALNVMTRETATVLRQVDQISAKVAAASSSVRERSESAVSVAEQGSREITAASKELDAAAEALRLIAGRARAADASAEEAIAATRRALANVQETVGGITASRDLIHETEKRIKRLGERSQEITSVVELIGDIAERTSMLAINTSMQAVAAGEAGRAYAVVADEVKRLAESARNATQQIATLVGAMRSETADTVDAINKAITHIVETSRVAERAGEAMRSTEQKTDQLVTSVRDITQTTEEQSRASDTLKQRAQQIERSTASTTEQMRHQAAETRELAAFAEKLLGSVRVFNLPA
jgi:methyl-accepting chemotaxis protein